jgi:hypothetical protein
MILRQANPDQVDSINWDRMTFAATSYGVRGTRTLDLDDPFFARRQFEAFTSPGASLEEILDSLGCEQIAYTAALRSSKYYYHG